MTIGKPRWAQCVLGLSASGLLRSRQWLAVAVIIEQRYRMSISNLDRQQKIYEVIRDYCAENGFSPTYDEIAAQVGLASKSGVTTYIDALVAEGLVRRTPRGVIPVEASDE